MHLGGRGSLQCAMCKPSCLFRLGVDCSVLYQYACTRMSSIKKFSHFWQKRLYGIYSRISRVSEVSK